ncbi:MAG TPA: hypothetical protein VMI33_22310 [Streptosporangiaceae bacterium]|nr:hypothetical protein [Streptosporangiaceae bacterium]
MARAAGLASRECEAAEQALAQHLAHLVVLEDEAVAAERAAASGAPPP